VGQAGEIIEGEQVAVVGRNHQLAFVHARTPAPGRHWGRSSGDWPRRISARKRPCPPGTRGLWLSLTGALLSENERAIYRTGQLRFARASTVAESQESVLAGASTLACPNGEAGGIGQATCRRRRLARANRPPQAATNPGRPAPTIGPGTAVAEIDSSKTFPAVAEKV
jgi:hypothetical protein